MNALSVQARRPGEPLRARRPGWTPLVLVLACLGMATAHAQTPVDAPAPPDPTPGMLSGKHVRELAEGVRCGSVVIRHCRLRRETSSMVLDPSLRGRNGAPMQWEVVQFGGPDNDEIVVNGERIRDPGLYEVFVRAFGAPAGSDGMLTRTAAGGARCTVVERSGATLCSNPGSGLPALDNPLTDWTF